jgi:hypothetical protein
MPARAWHGARPEQARCHDHELPAPHDTHAPPAAANHPAVHPLRRNPAGFWVSHNGDQTVRRPWCLSCCQDLDPACHHVIPFDS